MNEARKREYIIDCLKAAVSYCKNQYEESEIDWLPTVAFVDATKDERFKFELLQAFLQTL